MNHSFPQNQNKTCISENLHLPIFLLPLEHTHFDCAGKSFFRLRSGHRIGKHRILAVLTDIPAAFQRADRAEQILGAVPHDRAALFRMLDCIQHIGNDSRSGREPTPPLP